MVLHIALYRLHGEQRLVTHGKRIGVRFAEVVNAYMQRKRHIEIERDETADEMLVTFLDAHKFLGAEAYEMIGVKVRRETVG